MELTSITFLVIPLPFFRSWRQEEKQARSVRRPVKERIVSALKDIDRFSMNYDETSSSRAY
jgi:hypothetical protein